MQSAPLDGGGERALKWSPACVVSHGVVMQLALDLPVPLLPVPDVVEHFGVALARLAEFEEAQAHFVADPVPVDLELSES